LSGALIFAPTPNIVGPASHASQLKLHNKHQPGDAYNPAAFIDKPGYDAALKRSVKAI
jgi:metallo-beta-lactamase class B